MRKTIKDLTDIMLAYDTPVDMGCSVSFTDQEAVEHSFDLWDSDTWYTVMRKQFGQRLFDDWEGEETDDEYVQNFFATMSAWVSTRNDTYARRLFALSQDFKPLENYNSTETREGSFTHGESVTLSFTNRKDTHKDDSFVEKSFNNYEEKEQDDSSNTRTFTNYTETERDDSSNTRSYTNYNETNTHSISADDSGTYVPSSQDAKGVTGSYSDTKGFVNGDVKTISGSITDTKGFTVGDKKTISGTIKDQKGFTLGATDEKAGSETTAHSGTDEDEYTIRRFGNIGVTTSQQMLASDLDLLRYDIVMQAMKEWVQQYTFISEEVN